MHPKVDVIRDSYAPLVPNTCAYHKLRLCDASDCLVTASTNYRREPLSVTRSELDVNKRPYGTSNKLQTLWYCCHRCFVCFAQEFVLNCWAVSGGSASNRRSDWRRNDIVQLTELQRCACSVEVKFQWLRQGANSPMFQKLSSRLCAKLK